MECNESHGLRNKSNNENALGGCLSLGWDGMGQGWGHAGDGKEVGMWTVISVSDAEWDGRRRRVRQRRKRAQLVLARQRVGLQLSPCVPVPLPAPSLCQGSHLCPRWSRSGRSGPGAARTKAPQLDPAELKCSEKSVTRCQGFPSAGRPGASRDGCSLFPLAALPAS